MQKSYLMKLCDLAEKDPNVLLLLADSGTSYENFFRKSFPYQYLEFGIAEENMVGAAAGLASCGMIPFVFTNGSFLAYRALEYIRDDVCLQNMNVKLVGTGTGISPSTLGPTHHATEDLGILRILPRLLTLTPSCPSMAAKCVELAYNYTGPVYIRIGMGGEPELYEQDYDLQLGKNNLLREGKDIVILVSGSIASEVLKACRILDENGISASVYDVFSIQPFDENCVVEAAKVRKPIITVEEHSVIGGIGTAATEAIVRNGLSTKLLKIGLENGFAVGYGTYEEVRKLNGLDADSIAKRIMTWSAQNE